MPAKSKYETAVKDRLAEIYVHITTAEEALRDLRTEKDVLLKIQEAANERNGGPNE